MTELILLAIALPGGIITAFTALAFCGLAPRHAVNIAALLGAAAVGLEFVMNWFGVDIWITALALLCLGGAALILAFRRGAALCAAPGALFFCALRLIDRGAFNRIISCEPEGVRIVLGLVWLGLLTGGFFAVQAAFSGEVWAEAKDGQPGTENILRLTLLLCVVNLPPFLAALPVSGLLMGLSAILRCVLIGIECALLGMAVLCSRLILRVGQKNRAILFNHQTQQELNHFMTIIRSQRHDYNLHLHAVAGLLREGRYEESQQYIADVVTDSQGVNVMMKIREPMIGALISGYRDLAREQGCELDISITDDLGALVSTPYDTNRILGNLLQNALDEVSLHAVQDKRIRLETLRRGGYSVIRVSNAVRDAENLKHLFEYGFSGKDAHEGIGLNSVMRILELYKGSIYYELKGGRVEFVVKIPNRI